VNDVRHRHWWVATVDEPRLYACADCPATAHQCANVTRHQDGKTVLCRTILEGPDRICPECVSRARNTLLEVRDLYRTLPDVIAAAAGLHAVRYDRGGTGKPVRATDTTIIGGAALVMAAGGTWDKTKLGRHETASSVDPALLDAERHDPPSVLAVLTFREDQWRDERGDGAAETTSVDTAVTYLHTHTSWAAQQSHTWDEWQADLHALHGRLLGLSGQTNTPKAENAPCVHCGGIVVHRWADTGLDDLAECTRCGMTWPDEDRLRHVNHLTVLALPQTRPEELVTLEDAKRIYDGRVKGHTLDVWAARGAIRPAVDDAGAARKDVRGRPLYRLGSIEQAVTLAEEAAS